MSSTFRARRNFFTSSQAKEIIIDSQSPDAKLGIAALYAKYGGSNLNLTLLKLLDIDAETAIFPEGAKGSCTLEVNCEELHLQGGAYGGLTINRRLGIVRGYYVDFESKTHPTPGNPINEQEALSKAREIIAITNPNVASPPNSGGIDTDGNFRISFSVTKHLSAQREGMLEISSKYGKVVSLSTLLMDRLTDYNEKISQKRAEQIAVEYASKHGVHQAKVRGPAFIFFTLGASGPKPPEPHVCATYHHRPRYVWSVCCEPDVSSGIDRIVGYANQTLGTRYWLRDYKSCILQIDIETGEVSVSEVFKGWYPDISEHPPAPAS